MIISLLTICLAFVWLLYESDWMRIRLLAGANTPPVPRIRLYRHGTWLTRQDRTYPAFDKYADTALSAGIEEPICGWDWLIGRDHPLVEYSFTLTAWGCTHNLTINPDAHKGQIVKECCKVAFAKPRNGNGRKPKHSKGLTFNPYYTLTRPKRRKSNKRRQNELR